MEDADIKLCSYEMALPDTATLHGRLYLGAWEAGLETVADETAPLLLHAVEVSAISLLFVIFLEL